MNLENIGFYTLSEKRARQVSWTSDLQRCELILTDRCNFRCLYCRGIKEDARGDMSYDQAVEVVNLWTNAKLHNIRFSGGEPTIWPQLLDLVKYTKTKPSIEHIALSTNGSAILSFYKELHDAGVNDFSISLDACCAQDADKMAGVNARFEHISGIIKELSQLTYVSVGVVLDERNIDKLQNIIQYATDLGVSDIRIIPSAQSNQPLNIDIKTDYNILKYRISNIQKGIHVRGLKDFDCSKCHLVKDDMVVLHGEHYPCVIYMREQGKAIGSVYGKDMKQIREERRGWFDVANTQKDPICKKNCLDVCIAHNNAVEYYDNGGEQ